MIPMNKKKEVCYCGKRDEYVGRVNMNDPSSYDHSAVRSTTENQNGRTIKNTEGLGHSLTNHPTIEDTGFLKVAQHLPQYYTLPAKEYIDTHF